MMTERPASNELVHPADAFHPVRQHASRAHDTLPDPCHGFEHQSGQVPHAC